MCACVRVCVFWHVRGRSIKCSKGTEAPVGGPICRYFRFRVMRCYAGQRLVCCTAPANDDDDDEDDDEYHMMELDLAQESKLHGEKSQRCLSTTNPS
jgi:hypothetical protein